jgi:hypothetical protein
MLRQVAATRTSGSPAWPLGAPVPTATASATLSAATSLPPMGCSAAADLRDAAPPALATLAALALVLFLAVMPPTWCKEAVGGEGVG